MEDVRYPIGLYQPQPFSPQQKNSWLTDIKQLPAALEHSIQNLDSTYLHMHYREGGWTVHQLVHHVADSHMNAYIRFKLGITEENPVIKPYEEKRWAELADVQVLPVNLSVTLLYALHTRWYEAIKDLTDAAWQRTVFHPGIQKELTLWHLLGSYAWHGKHHTAQIHAFRLKEQV